MRDSEKFELQNRVFELKMQRLELSRRGSGRTTRHVDKYIQTMYDHIGIWVSIVDHYDSLMANKMIAEMVIKRMEREHTNDKIEWRNKGNGVEIRIVSCPSEVAKNEQIERLKKEIEEIEAKLKKED